MWLICLNSALIIGFGEYLLSSRGTNTCIASYPAIFPPPRRNDCVGRLGYEASDIVRVDVITLLNRYKNLVA